MENYQNNLPQYLQYQQHYLNSAYNVVPKQTSQNTFVPVNHTQAMIDTSQFDSNYIYQQPQQQSTYAQHAPQYDITARYSNLCIQPSQTQPKQNMYKQPIYDNNNLNTHASSNGSVNTPCWQPCQPIPDLYYTRKINSTSLPMASYQTKTPASAIMPLLATPTTPFHATTPSLQYEMMNNRLLSRYKNLSNTQHNAKYNESYMINLPTETIQTPFNNTSFNDHTPKSNFEMIFYDNIYDSNEPSPNESCSSAQSNISDISNSLDESLFQLVQTNKTKSTNENPYDQYIDDSQDNSTNEQQSSVFISWIDQDESLLSDFEIHMREVLKQQSALNLYIQNTK